MQSAQQPGGIVLPGGPAPAPVDPTLTISQSVLLVARSYTEAARATLTVGTSAPNFPRGAVLTRSGPEIELFDAASGGQPIPFTGQNTLVLTAADLNGNRQLFVQAAAPSSGVNRSSLTLALVAGGAPSVGNPVGVTLTCVRLTLDVGGQRPDPATAPPLLPQPPAAPGPNPTDKWHGGRVVSAQDRQRSQERAQMLVRTPEPPDFNLPLVVRQVEIQGNSVIGPDDRLRLFQRENPAGGGETPFPNPRPVPPITIPNNGLEMWVEGRTLSADRRDVGYQLGVQNIDFDGDRVAFTVGVGGRIAPASRVVAVRKPHTRPDRHRVVVQTASPFTRDGVLTRSSDAIRLFDRARGGTEIVFDANNQHTFTGQELTRGQRLFAEGASASGAVDDVLLTLTLDDGGGAAPFAGVPARVRMTAVDVRLEIFASRPAPGTAPPALSEADKVAVGRFVQLRDPGFTHERTLLKVHPPTPSDFAGELVLSRINNRISAFFDEEPVDGQRPTDRTVRLLTPIIPQDGAEFWLEGVRVSARARDTGFRLGIRDVATEADRVAATIVGLEITDRAAVGRRPVAFTRFGLWNRAYDAAENVRGDDFLRLDRRSFFFRVHDRAAQGDHLELRWRTLQSDRATAEDDPADPVLSLPRVAASSPFFLSRAVMLVTNDEDRDQRVHSGLPGSFNLTEPRAHTDSNHRLRKATLDGFVRGEYSPAAQPGVRLRVTRPLFERDPDDRRRVRVRVVRYTSTTAGFAAASPAYIASQFARANLRWNQIGLQIDALATSDRVIPAAAVAGPPGDPRFPFPNVVNTPEEDAVLADLIPVTPDDTLTVVFVPLRGANAFAEIRQVAPVPLAAGGTAAMGDRFFVFIHTGLVIDDETLGHELHHVLFNRFDVLGTQRRFFTFNTAPPSNIVAALPPPGIALPDPRIYKRIQDRNSPNPNNDPQNRNVINWARRTRTARFPLPIGFAAANATTGNRFLEPF